MKGQKPNRDGPAPKGSPARLGGLSSAVGLLAMLVLLGVLIAQTLWEQPAPLREEVDASGQRSWASLWTARKGRIGLCIAGAAAVSVLMLLYWSMRSRLRSIAPIADALRTMRHTETPLSALTVAGRVGPEAAAWNALLNEFEELHRALSLEQAKKTLVQRSNTTSDLSTACEAMSQGLIVLDERGRVRYANGAAMAFFSGEREKIVGTDIGEFIVDQSVVEAIRSAFAGSVFRRQTIEVDRTDSGGPVLRVSIRPVHQHGSTAGIVVVEDITQHRVASEARDAFLAKATHELRTPLMNIILYVETAMDEAQDNPALRAQALNVINQEARRLEEMVGDILSVSQIEAGSLSLRTDDVRLDALFAEIEDDYEAQAAEKQIDLVFNLPPKLEAIQGDREKIAVALHNLIGNALKYTPAGRKIEVNVRLEPDQFTVEVADTGIGISEEDAEHVFERFYRAKDSRVDETTGSGLGLPLAREMVRLHGGDITLHSELNVGSTFTLTLPVQVEVAVG